MKITSNKEVTDARSEHFKQTEGGVELLKFNTVQENQIRTG